MNSKYQVSHIIVTSLTSMQSGFLPNVLFLFDEAARKFYPSQTANQREVSLVYYERFNKESAWRLHEAQDELVWTLTLWFIGHPQSAGKHALSLPYLIFTSFKPLLLLAPLGQSITHQVWFGPLMTIFNIVIAHSRIRDADITTWNNWSGSATSASRNQMKASPKSCDSDIGESASVNLTKPQSTTVLSNLQHIHRILTS